MKNFVQRGDSIDAPPIVGNTVYSGDVYVYQSLVGVAVTDDTNLTNGKFAVAVTGVYRLPKAAATVFEFGAAVYWNLTSKLCTAGPAAVDCAALGICVTSPQVIGSPSIDVLLVQAVGAAIVP